MYSLIVTLLLLCAVYLFLIRGRTGCAGLKALKDHSYAHRGLHGNGVPENSMEAFRLAKEAGYGVELDIHLMADGGLAVIHDSSLKRTAGADIRIEDLTAGELAQYRLEGTQEGIPEFKSVLALFEGKVPVIVELKSAGGNSAALCQAACKLLESYEGPYCIESFDPRCIRWLKINRPELIRGQLSENYFASRSSLPWFLKLALSFHMLNFLTQPDFVAYRWQDHGNLSNTLCRKLWGIQGVAWTLRSPEDYADAVKDNWIPIFEGFRP